MLTLKYNYKTENIILLFPVKVTVNFLWGEKTKLKQLSNY